MADYTFHTLNDRDFEHLVRDLLQEELGLRFETFKSGKDQGIDLRYSSSAGDPNAIVVQAKHWSKSGFSAFLRHLATKELPKVRVLSPTRYIVTTSVALSPKNKQEILSALRPFVISSGDIFGLEDLNSLLGKYPDIEKQHYKLWISSVAVMERILHNAISGRSEFVQDEIQKKASLFVPTRNYSDAIEILNNTGVLLIKGVPGVGKTTLAQFLIYRMLSDGFELAVIDEDLKDGEDVYKNDAKQVFYFDDFLGSNYLELIHSKGSGSRIARFVDRVQRDKQKRLVLTTRTTILNRALAQMHQIGSPQLIRTEFELHIEDYSRLDRARILYNHLYFSDLEKEYFHPLFENESYLKVIDHKNYNPRIIEFITDGSRLADVASDEYLGFVEQNLNAPEAIWEVAYEHQIDQEARLLLETLFSFGGVVSEDVLQEAFEARLSYEVDKGGLQRSGNAFHSSVRLLLGGFLVRAKGYGAEGQYSFVNPSIVDFFVSYFSRDKEEKWRILECVVFVEQLSGRLGVNRYSPIRIENEEVTRYRDTIIAKLPNLKSSTGCTVELKAADLLLTSFAQGQVSETIELLLRQVDLECISYLDFRALIDVVEKVSEGVGAVQLVEDLLDDLVEDLWGDLVEDLWDDWILVLFRVADEKEQFDEIVDLFEKCGTSYEDWIRAGSNREAVQECVDQFWEETMDFEISDDSELKNVFEEQDLEDAQDALKRKVESINERLRLADSPSFTQIEWIDKDEKLAENQLRAEAEDYQAEALREGGAFTGHSEDAAIRELFSR